MFYCKSLSSVIIASAMYIKVDTNKVRFHCPLGNQTLGVALVLIFVLYHVAYNCNSGKSSRVHLKTKMEDRNNYINAVWVNVSVVTYFHFNMKYIN